MPTPAIQFPPFYNLSGKTWKKGAKLHSMRRYSTMLDEMNEYGDLYGTPNRLLRSLRVRYTHRALIEIKNAVGLQSPIFTQKLPRVVSTILKGEEVLIQNSATKKYLCASPTDNSTILLSDKDNDIRCTWKLKLPDVDWTKPEEQFHVENAFNNNMFTEFKDSITLIETEYEHEGTRCSIHVLKGATGDEVSIEFYAGVPMFVSDGDLYVRYVDDERKYKGELVSLLQPNVE